MCKQELPHSYVLVDCVASFQTSLFFISIQKDEDEGKAEEEESLRAEANSRRYLGVLTLVQFAAAILILIQLLIRLVIFSPSLFKQK